MLEVWMCGFQGTRENRKEAQIVRRVSKKEATVKNGRSGNQEDKGLHKPFIGIPVTMAKGSHLFPYRTQKLSLSAPMVLGWRRPGRVGRCRIPNEKRLHSCGVFLHLQSNNRFIIQAASVKYMQCIWLGESLSAASGGKRGEG